MTTAPAGFVDVARAGVSSTQMPNRPVSRRLRMLARAGLVLYALFLVAVPFAHHDLSCELKTPQHCMACTSSLVGAGPDSSSVPGVCHLTDAGRAVSIQVVGADTVLAVRSTGRSPPACA
jgi:hypothetical protein